nr:MAG TPA: hypothetical protein [Caudoviricetes sp.]
MFADEGTKFSLGTDTLMVDVKLISIGFQIIKSHLTQRSFRIIAFLFRFLVLIFVFIRRVVSFFILGFVIIFRGEGRDAVPRIGIPMTLDRRRSGHDRETSRLEHQLKSRFGYSNSSPTICNRYHHAGFLLYSGLDDIQDVDAVSSLKGGQADHGDLGLNIDRISLFDGGHSYTEVGDGNIGNLAAHQVGLFRSGAEPSVAQSTLGEQSHDIIRNELSRIAGIVLVTLAIDDQFKTELIHQILAQTGIAESSNLTVGQDEDGLDDLLVDTEISPSLAGANTTSRAHASIVLDLVHGSAHVLDGVRGRGAPGNGHLRLVIRRQTVVIAVGLAIRGDSDGTSGQSHHTHLLTTSTSTLKEMDLIGKDAVHDRVNVRLIAGLEDHVELLTKLFIDVSALLEEGHLGLQLVKADTRTRNSTDIKCRGLENDGKTVGALDPAELQTQLFVSGEQFLAEIGRHILNMSFPIGSQFRSLDEIKNRHLVILLSFLS